jgi:hypothetical protein
MEQQQIVMILGFALAAYSVIGNDVIQTLGTFLSSNEKKPWYVLFAFIGTLLVAVVIYGWATYDGDVSYGRLIGDPPKYSLENPKYPIPDDFGWIYLFPPIVLLFLTRSGIPVSTSFLILTFFNQKSLEDMVKKSLSGYVVAFFTAILLYLFIVKTLENKFVHRPMTTGGKRFWTAAQWFSTSFLWIQWLIQDFANIYVYLPRQLSLYEMLGSLILLLSLLAYIFYSKGGAIQSIVKRKTNTVDIRSATFIDLSYGFVLLIFQEMNRIPMSTTWVFIGLLAGREIALRYNMYGKVSQEIWKDLGKDLGKVLFGLIVSIGLVYILKLFA